MGLVRLLNVTGDAALRQDRIYGVVTGIVRDIKDPRNLGRVKVNFPWLAEDADTATTKESKQEDKAHSYWARVATLMAGKKRGAWFIPEVGDEVLVAFEHGYIHRPMIVGMLWNADDPPSEQMDGDGKNNIRSIHSRSGHKIILNDSDDEPSITIVDQTGDNSIFIDSANNAMEIKVAGDLTIEVGGNISITAKGKVDLDATQDIAAQTKANLGVKVTGSGKLESTGPLDIKSSAKLTADGTGRTEVKAATVTVSGSAMTEVKGALVKIN
jgi:uncharacterized protein involved in type VI secretion and phage assembly